MDLALDHLHALIELVHLVLRRGERLCVLQRLDVHECIAERLVLLLQLLEDDQRLCANLGDIPGMILLKSFKDLLRCSRNVKTRIKS